MGIQINGTTDTITASDGSWSIQDKTGSKGAANQVLTAGTSGSELQWSNISSIPGSSTNYIQTLGTQVVVTPTSIFPVDICSVSITTNGRPVLICANGDVNFVSTITRTNIQLYRGTTGLGLDTTAQTQFLPSTSPFALSFIDAPAAGTYTYTLKCNGVITGGGGSINFSYSGGPTIFAYEL